MNDTQAIAEFVRLSVKFGSNVSMVQGAGGNTSVKLADGGMVVKASGGQLKQISATSGWVKVPTRVMRELIAAGPSGDRFEQRIDDSLVEGIDKATERFWPGAQKASIEASMHGLFAKFVVHLHPVELNTVLTAENGRELLNEILPHEKYLWIDVVPPGYYLARAIYDAVQGDLRKFPSLVFLASHGVIAHGDDPIEVENLLVSVSNKVSTWLDKRLIDRKPFDPKINWQSELSEPEIFPDTVVFREHAKEYSKLAPNTASAISETYAASAFMRQNHRLLGLKSQLIPSEVCEYILGMSREKHRQQLYSSPNRKN